MKKEFVAPTIEKIAFKLSDLTMCDSMVSDGVTTDAGANAKAYMTEESTTSALE